MGEIASQGVLFDKPLLEKIRSKFHRINTDADGEPRLFFENAGGSLRLKSVCTISDELNKYPDCYERNHKSSKVLKDYELKGKEDFRTLINAQDGAIATDLTASSIIFDIIGSIAENSSGTNIVTTCLEHPSAFDACRYHGQRCNKSVRVASANQSTGGITAEAVLKHVDKNTALIVVIAASNMTGAITELEAIVEGARKINPDVFIVSDAVQHAPHALIDIEKLKIDGLNMAPYKFFGNRGISFAYVSNRVKNLPHKRILDDAPDMWELGSIAPAHYAAMSEVVNYIAWIGSHYTNSTNKRALVVEGMNRIVLHERALLHRTLHGSAQATGLLAIEGVHTYFNYSHLENRDFILAMGFHNIGFTEAVREYEKRGVIVFERVASSIFSKRIVEAVGLDGLIRVSPLHCNTPEEIDRFLDVSKEIAML